MAAWAAGGKFPSTGFLCICVDPDAFGTAREFSQLYFGAAPSSLVNGYIDSKPDFPNFQAQLGCQGFVVFNSSHHIVAPKTLPWMQHRNNAFHDVEGKLLQLLQPPAPQNPLGAPVGQRVRVVGLTSTAGAELNGQLGEVIGSKENGRFLVKLGSGAAMALRPESLEDAAGAPVGRRVRVEGLTSAKGQELNGQVGEVLGGADGGRYLVRLSSGVRSLRTENLGDAEPDEPGAGEPLGSVPSVGHEAMDGQHASCVDALNALSQRLSVPALQHVRDDLAAHFQEEEALLRESGFGSSPCAGSCKKEESCQAAEFSALGSHVADHKRIIDIADAALAALQNACASSEGAVPRDVAAQLRRAFVEHASLYDALYTGKVAAPVA
mmetsp:Transcript_86021/g.244013  ORF Transcript_86021/g.244013 Transcript_86021/m.244013 type:complete len:381 (+) Transcript_86021:259-1401(+)